MVLGKRSNSVSRSSISNTPFPLRSVAFTLSLLLYTELHMVLLSTCFQRVIYDMPLPTLSSQSKSVVTSQRSATLSDPEPQEVDVGLAADIGTLARFPKIVGNESAVRELAYTARNFDAREAEKIGFVSRVVEGSRDEVLVAALQVAKQIASKSPIPVTGTKHLLLHSRDHS